MVRVLFVVGSKGRGAYPRLGRSLPFSARFSVLRSLSSRALVIISLRHDHLTPNNDQESTSTCSHREYMDMANCLGLERVWSLPQSTIHALHAYASHRRPCSTFRSVSGFLARSAVGLWFIHPTSLVSVFCLPCLLFRFHTCMSSPSSHSDHESLPTPLSRSIRPSSRPIYEYTIMLVYPQETFLMKNACLVYVYILMYCPRPTPTPAKHHRPSNLSSPIFYLNKTLCLSYTITILVFSLRVSFSAFSPPTHLGYPAPQPARIPLLCSTLDEMVVLVFRMFCLNLLLSQGLHLTFLLD
jgi:hypothetical protein